MDSISDYQSQAMVIADLQNKLTRLEAENKRLTSKQGKGNLDMVKRLNIAFMLGLDLSTPFISDEMGVSTDVVYVVKKLITV